MNAFKPFIPVFIFTLAVSACREDLSSAPVNMTALQEKLNDDPEVRKFRKIFGESALIAASFSPEELSAFLQKQIQCGPEADLINGNIEDVNRCLSGLPKAERFIEYIAKFRSVLIIHKEIVKRHPEIEDLPNQHGLILGIGDLDPGKLKQMIESQSRKKTAEPLPQANH